jgi:hypothetical protein
MVPDGELGRVSKSGMGVEGLNHILDVQREGVELG